MKTKLVLWGTDADENKVLIALSLRTLENKVDIWTFPENIVTEEFGKSLMDEWRNGNDLEFPEGNIHLERELTMTEGLLPDDIKVSRGDLIQRAQTEWHFAVLSARLNQAYQAEFTELKEKVEKLSSFDASAWESLKIFWGKVQNQVRDRNLFREHADNLRDGTNELFAKLKEMRSSFDEEFNTVSKKHFDDFAKTLEDVEKRVSEGMNLTVIFEELKNIQRDFKEARFNKEHRSKIWQKIDDTFKVVKEKRFGSNAFNESSPQDRVLRRYDGLMNAIHKMETSIHRDREDQGFQSRRVESSEGQLEAQIRQAKIKMINERIVSKEEKLNDMLKTKVELEGKIASINAKAAKQEEIEAAKKTAKERIANKIKLEESSRTDEDTEKLEKAAEAIKEKREGPGESLLGAIGTTFSETLEDVVDTIKAVAEVIGDKIEEKVEEFKVDMQEVEEKPNSKEEE
ncbi:MAG: hypothetical protein ACI8P3_000941 [Saprospiraceae bacterium]|jgi:uncharacterized protein YicC (UPF0701 family)